MFETHRVIRGKRGKAGRDRRPDHVPRVSAGPEPPLRSTRQFALDALPFVIMAVVAFVAIFVDRGSELLPLLALGPAFAAVSGDHNPLHLDEDYAHKTVFRGRVAHGMLLGAHISAVLGDTLPGPGAIYLSQTLEFEHPVRIPSEVTVRVEVKSIDEHRRATLSTVCSVDGQVVAKGEAVVIPPRRRKSRPSE